MRALAAKINSYLCRKTPANQQFRNLSSVKGGDDLSLEQEAERKVGWLLKLCFAGTATAAAYHIFPYLGDNMMHQSISLLRVKDPMFKRMGASRLSRFAIDDERRMLIVELGGAEELLKMLEDAKDDRTRKEAFKALVTLSRSDKASGVLHKAGAALIVRSTPDSFEDAEIEKYKSTLLKRFQDFVKSDTSS